jgi:hypothetical protein
MGALGTPGGLGGFLDPRGTRHTLNWSGLAAGAEYRDSRSLESIYSSCLEPSPPIPAWCNTPHPSPTPTSGPSQTSPTKSKYMCKLFKSPNYITPLKRPNSRPIIFSGSFGLLKISLISPFPVKCRDTKTRSCCETAASAALVRYSHSSSTFPRQFRPKKLVIRDAMHTKHSLRR